MKAPVLLRFTRLEVIFLLVAFAVLALGTWLSVKLCQSDLMAGVGALIVVLGVIFATFDLRNILELKANEWARVRKEFAVQSTINDIEEEKHTVLSEEDRQRLRMEVERYARHFLPSQGPQMRRRFHLVEVFIVCLGTLVNGFGQKVLEWLLA